MINPTNSYSNSLEQLGHHAEMHLPTEAVMALGDPLKELAAGQHLAATIEQLRAELESLKAGTLQPAPAPGIGPKSPADNDYKPGFAAPLMLKDLNLSQEAATSVGAETALGQHAAEIYARFVAEGGAEKDFSGVLPWLAAMTRKA